MKKLKRLSSLLVVLLLLFTSMPSIANAATSVSNVKIHYIDVGQGDSELIQVNGKNILIDAGTSDMKAVSYLKKIGVAKLDYIIATHPHEDHIGSMDDVVKDFNVGTFYAPKVTTTTTTYSNMVNALKAKNLKITVPTVGSTLTIGDATLTFLAPNSSTYQNLNNYSIIVKLKYGNNSFIFMGDAEGVPESEILAKQLDVQADVLKVGHHGSTSSTTQAFLDKVNPKYAIIEVGKGNDYGHPADTTLAKLNTKKIKTFRTDLDGTIIATSNGTDITFNTNSVDSTDNTTNSDNTKQSIVWIASSSAKVYHTDKTCSNMKNPIEISLSNAQEQGLKLCLKCK